MSFDSLAYLFFVGFFAIFGVAIVVGVLRWALRINETVSILQAILEEMRRQSPPTSPDA